jgi:hypothetical protein
VKIFNRANGKTAEVEPVKSQHDEWDDYDFPSGPADAAALKAKGHVTEEK